MDFIRNQRLIKNDKQESLRLVLSQGKYYKPLSKSTNQDSVKIEHKKRKTIEKAKPLEHWKGLKLGRKREFEGTVYDKSIVKRVFPDEIHGWEHSKTTPILVEVAKNNAWEECAIPPILLVHTPEKNETGHQYAIYDGHHRLNAASSANFRREKGTDLVGVPAIVVGTWFKNDSGSFLGYNNCPTSITDERDNEKWNPKNVPQRAYVREGIKEKNIWGAKELEITLEGERIDNNLKELVGMLNNFKRPNEFLEDGKGDTLRIRVSTDNAKLPGFPEKTKKDIEIKISDLKSKDWSEVLSNTKSFRELLGSSKNKSVCPILNVQIQQSQYSFITEGY